MVGASYAELTRNVSKHLARLRDDGLVSTRREAQTIFYRIEDTRVEALVSTLKRVFCP